MINRFKLRKKLSVVATCLMIATGYQNCADQEFSSVTDPVTQTGGPDCSEQLKKITTPIEMIFVLDVSGSNVGESGQTPTDPDKVVRGGSTQKFYDTYKAKTNFEWSMITFQSSSATTRLKIGDADQMEQIIADFMSLSDSGKTPYAAALSSTTNLITGHTTRAQYTKYIVVFMSDGKPDPTISDSDLQTAVQDLVGSLPGEVSLNTLYYGPKNKEASDRLRMMAQVGGGNFLDTNANPTGNSFLISDLVVIPSTTCD